VDELYIIISQQQEEAAAPGGEGCGRAQQQLFRRFEAVADKLLSDSEDDDEIHAWVVAQLFHGASPGGDCGGVPAGAPPL